MIIKRAYRNTSRTRDRCLNEMVRMVVQRVDWTLTDLIMTSLKGERKGENRTGVKCIMMEYTWLVVEKSVLVKYLERFERK